MLDALDDLAKNDFEQFGYIYQLVDGSHTWDDLVYVADTYGSEIIFDVVDFADMMEDEFVGISEESGTKQQLARRIFDWLHAHSPTNIALDWKRKAVANTEDWLRSSLDDAVANGLDPEAAFFVGYCWGLVQTADALSDLADGRVVVDMVSTIVTTVMDASRGDVEAQKALQAMSPVYGSYLVSLEAVEHLDNGEYFDAGIKTMQVVTEGVETLAGGASVILSAKKAMIRRGGRQLTKVNELRLKNGDLDEFKDRSSRGTGALGEALAMNYLDQLGYKRITQLQNVSGHGIDVVAISPKGHVVFVEVKASKNISGIRLSKTQVEFEKFVDDRLALIEDQADNYRHVSDQVAADAEYFRELLKDGTPVHYRAIAIDKAFDEWAAVRDYVFDQD